MAHFPDFSEYTYAESARRPNTWNIGWLDKIHSFETEQPTTEEALARLWSFCEWSIPQKRGFHICDLPGCRGHLAEYGPLSPKRGRLEGRGPICAKRGDVVLILGTAEIRVFGEDGRIYAAPNLIYHYVTVHFYRMPDEFERALFKSPCPPSPEYFERLSALGLNWNKTLVL